MGLPELVQALTDGAPFLPQSTDSLPFGNQEAVLLSPTLTFCLDRGLFCGFPWRGHIYNVYRFRAVGLPELVQALRTELPFCRNQLIHCLLVIRKQSSPLLQLGFFIVYLLS